MSYLCNSYPEVTIRAIGAFLQGMYFYCNFAHVNQMGACQNAGGLRLDK